ncbi:MAG: hypothetical protein KKD17_05565 [Nanoarchaeota archaeon]|nr:hypothetical protein [Nanoarchaeota archaeon]
MPDRKVVTRDGSTTFYSEDYDETYHSTSGALTEADKKYSEACRIQDREEADILDICFGLGYNSAAAIDRFRGKRLRIVGLEQNRGIVEEIVRMGDEYPFRCKDIMKKVVEQGEYHRPAAEGRVAGERMAGTVDVKLIMGDARETIKHLADRSFDCAFLDPFSPKKCPELWTKEFFDEMYRVLRKGGVVATYSCARIVRENFKAAGFKVSDGPIIYRRGPATVAEKACGNTR